MAKTENTTVGRDAPWIHIENDGAGHIYFEASEVPGIVDDGETMVISGTISREMALQLITRLSRALADPTYGEGAYLEE